MLLMKRSTGAKHTRNANDLVRQWSADFTERLMSALRSQFPEYDLKLFSDTDELLMGCHACQVRAFAEADVLIGMHGAGLSNQLYMKPNSAIVELCPYPNDGRCLLGGGPFSRTAALLSHNYMIHHPPHSEYKWIVKDKTSEFDVERFVGHIYSYLQSVKATP
jgi:Glycosyltransferase 61